MRNAEVLNPKSIAYTKAHMLQSVCVCVLCGCTGGSACDGVGVRSCGLQMDNKKLIATNSCAIFSVRLETFLRWKTGGKRERGSRGWGCCDKELQHETMFTFYSFLSSLFHVFRPVFEWVSFFYFLVMPSVTYFQLFDPLHFFIAFYPGPIWFFLFTRFPFFARSSAFLLFHFAVTFATSLFTCRHLFVGFYELSWRLSDACLISF